MTKAGILNRGIALFFDSIIGGLLFGILGSIVAAGVSSATSMTLGFEVIQAFTAFGLLGYFIYFEGRSGHTPAKMFLNLKVKKKDGSKCGYGSSLIRNVLRIIDILPQLYIIGIISIWLTGDNQRVGDLVAGTVVVDEGNQ